MAANWSVVSYFKGNRYATRVVSGLTWQEASDYATDHQHECPTEGVAQGLWVYTDKDTSISIYNKSGTRVVRSITIRDAK